MRAASMPRAETRAWAGAHRFWWVAAGALAGMATAELSGVLWLACLGWLISGLFLGVAQEFILRRSAVDARGWALVTVVAALATALLFGLLSAGFFMPGATFVAELADGLFAGALAGLLLGVCQYALLRAEFRGAGWWIAASVFGSAAGSGAASLLLWLVYGPVMIVRSDIAPVLLAAGLLQGGIYASVTATALPGLLLSSRRPYVPR